MRRVTICTAVLAVAIVASSVFVAVAQQGQPRRRRDFASQWKERLSLTDQQVEQIRKLSAGLRDKVRAAGDADARRAVRAQYQKDLRALLTPEQQVKYDAAIKSQQERAEMLRMDGALRGLELTKAQNDRIAALRKARDEKIKAAYAAYKASLTPLLTETQRVKFEENLKRRRRPGMVRGARGARGARGVAAP